jgi:hypothetical protein
MIEARERVEITHGYTNLGLIANNQLWTTNVRFDLIKQAFADFQWQMNEQEFKKKNVKLIQAIQQYQASGKKSRGQSKSGDHSQVA